MAAAVFFFSWSPEVRRPLPAVQAGGLPSPPTLARASSRRRRARPNHSSRHRWLRIRRGLVRRPGPERSDGAFDVCRPRPAPPGSTCRRRRRRRLCPDTGGQPLLPEAPASIPPDSAPRGGRAGGRARKRRPRRHAGTNRGRGQGRSRRRPRGARRGGGGRASGERGSPPHSPTPPRSRTGLRGLRPGRPGARAPRGRRRRASAGRGCMRLGGGN